MLWRWRRASRRFFTAAGAPCAAAAVASLALAAPAFAAPTAVSLNVQGHTIRSCRIANGVAGLSMNTRRTGWLELGCLGQSPSLYRTADDWRTWKAVGPLPEAYGAWTLESWSTLPGLAILLMSQGAYGSKSVRWRIVRLSADGQVAAYPLALPPVSGVVSVSFANEEDGAVLAVRGVWAGGSVADYMVTTDGGRTWATTSRTVGDVYLLLATSANDAYVGGDTPVADTLVLDRTTTAGRSWTRLRLPLPAVGRNQQVAVLALSTHGPEVDITVMVSLHETDVYAVGPSGTEALARFRVPKGFRAVALGGSQGVYTKGGVGVIDAYDGVWAPVFANGQVQAAQVRGAEAWILSTGPSTVTVTTLEWRA